MPFAAAAIVATAITVLQPADSPPSLVAMDAAPLPAACVQVGKYLTDWQRRFELRDWTIGYYCSPDPELGDDAEGTTSMVLEERAAVIRVHPSAPDPEEIAAHELAHVWMTYIREADSELVEEQAVRIFTRLLIAGKRCKPEVAP